MWEGPSRTSRTQAEQYLDQLPAGPLPADVHRLVHAYTDHNVIRVRGALTTVSRADGL
ncbi:hypothetical protein [Streptomyces sp. NPDC017673]|uniref:hypothetical protein n=1 Tax=unclassified Streptomyces TaxID=2593676 RepID=UPI00379E8AB7